MTSLPSGLNAIGSGFVVGRNFVEVELDLLEVTPQGRQAVVAVDVFSVRQDHAEQIGMGGTDFVDGLLQGGKELVESFVGEAEPARPGAVSSANVDGGDTGDWAGDTDFNGNAGPTVRETVEADDEARSRPGSRSRSE